MKRSFAEGPAAADAVASEDTVASAERLLRRLCDDHGIDASHGAEHALTVLAHLDAAVAVADPAVVGGALSADRVLALRLAALLHDADDKKYFGKPAPGAVAYGNARAIMAEAGAASAVVEDAVAMIDLVSCSANGNSCPSAAAEHPELLWPRWADRLEAVGEIGVVRCYAYNKHEGTTPLADEATPRATTAEEVLALATAERFERYQASGGGSATMLDHYYDKLLQVARPPPALVRNSYLERRALAGAEPLIAICCEYGRTGAVPVARIEAMARKLGVAC